eukprot:5588020-Prymnesium_polylepis.1
MMYRTQCTAARSDGSAGSARAVADGSGRGASPATRAVRAVRKTMLLILLSWGTRRKKATCLIEESRVSKWRRLLFWSLSCSCSAWRLRCSRCNSRRRAPSSDGCHSTASATPQ